MVSAINNSNAMHSTGPQKNVKVPVANSEETGETKMHSPPGQAAKNAIESYLSSKSDGTDLPANIQGKVASAKARGLNIGIEGLLTLQEVTSPDDVAATTEDETVPEDIDSPADAESDSAASMVQPDDSPSEAIIPVDNDATIAAALLEDAEQDADSTTQ